MKNVRIGSCSWVYDSWRGIIYPTEGKINYLREYAKHFDTAEIDRWFWSLFAGNQVRLPDPGTVREYLASVPQDFKFTVKVPNSITLTHFYRQKKNDSLMENPNFLSHSLWKKFLETIQPLKRNIGVLMFQFEYLNKQKILSQDRFLSSLDDFFHPIEDIYPIAVEVRNPQYLNERYFEFLNIHGLHHVWLQGYYMPSIFDVYLEFLPYASKMAVIRLMGPDRKDIEQKSGKQWNRILEPKDEQIDHLVSMVGDFLSQGTRVFINVNNHYEGSAPLTIQKIKSRLFP